MGNKRLWVGLGLVTAVSFAVLGWFGREIYRQAPPIPQQVATSAGRVLFTGEDIRDGQNVWQSIGGQQIGSIWGHGAYDTRTGTVLVSDERALSVDAMSRYYAALFGSAQVFDADLVGIADGGRSLHPPRAAWS